MSLKRITKHIVKPVAKGTVSTTPKDKTRKSTASKNREKMMTHSLSTEHQVTNRSGYSGKGCLVYGITCTIELLPCYCGLQGFPLIAFIEKCVFVWLDALSQSYLTLLDRVYLVIIVGG